MSPLVFVPLLSVAIAAATPLVGWLALPLAGGFGGLFLAPRGSLFLTAGGAGALAWMGWAAWSGIVGEALRLDAAASAVLGLPAFSFAGLTFLFAFLLTASAAVVGRWLKRLPMLFSSSA